MEQDSTEVVGEHLTVRTVPPARHVPSLAEDVIDGFDRDPRCLSPKYFYDDRGSELFDRICDTPEYYPTRTEHELLRRHADDIVQRVRPEHIVELGSGTSRKTPELLAACERAGLAPAYWPFDVCEGVLRYAGRHLLERFPWLQVEALVGDYTAGLDHLPRLEGRCLYVFLGGTFGNFEADAGGILLGELERRMGAGDALLLGVDRVKDPAVIEAAYSDAGGVTAAFNRNVLRVLNRELDGDFEPDAFRHEAIFSRDRGRIEMILRADRPQAVHLAGLGRTYRFAADEPLLTEISRKFTAEQLERELAAAGLVHAAAYVAQGDYFSLELVQPAAR